MSNKIKITDNLTQIALLLNHQLPISITKLPDGQEMEFDDDGEVSNILQNVETNTFTINSQNYKKGSKMRANIVHIVTDYMRRWDESEQKDRYVEFSNYRLQKLSLRLLGRRLTQTELENLLCDLEPNEIQKDIENKAVNLIKLISYDSNRRK